MENERQRELQLRLLQIRAEIKAEKELLNDSFREMRRLERIFYAGRCTSEEAHAARVRVEACKRAIGRLSSEKTAIRDELRAAGLIPGEVGRALRHRLLADLGVSGD